MQMSMSRGDETDRKRERERERETSAVRNFPDVTKRKRKAGTRKLPNKVNDKDPPGPTDARWHFLLLLLLHHFIIQPTST